jgi:tRNA A-37 threonylcarbamoyl transferase component Bud32
MRVFSVEMLVKEEGAATVQAALARLKKETQAVANDMKVTAQAVTNTGNAMQGAAAKTQIAGDRAAKAAIGFAAVGQSIARTGTLTADAGTRIIEAGSFIATAFGPTGLVVSALLGFAAAAATAFGSTSSEAKKMQEATTKALREMVLGGDITSINKQLRDVQQGILDLTTGEFTDGLDDLRAKYKALNDQIAATVITEKGRLVGGQNQVYMASAQEVAYNRLVASASNLRKQIQGLEADEARLLRARQLAQGFGAGAGAGVVVGGRPLGGLPGAGAGVTGVGRAPFDLGAIQAAIPQATGIILTDAQKAAVDLANGIQQTFQQNVGGALVAGISMGIEQAVASGSIGEGFRALGSMLLAGLGDAMIRFGTTTAAFAQFMATIMESLSNLMPGGALAASIAMIAFGSALKGVARGMFGGQGGGAAVSIGSFGGGGGGFGGGMGGAMPTTQLIFGQTSATTAAGMTPRQSMNVTVIGPNDPSAQRAIQELMTKANSRGRIG